MATTPDGRRIVFQRRHRRLDGRPLGSPVIHTVNGTARPVHNANIVIAVTNAFFATPAHELAAEQGIHLLFGERLRTWPMGCPPARFERRVRPISEPSAQGVDGIHDQGPRIRSVHSHAARRHGRPTCSARPGPALPWSSAPRYAPVPAGAPVPRRHETPAVGRAARRRDWAAARRRAVRSGRLTPCVVPRSCWTHGRAPTESPGRGSATSVREFARALVQPAALTDRIWPRRSSDLAFPPPVQPTPPQTPARWRAAAA
ncbi:restriction endonuclease [Streptomyces sp. NPDC059904]|uniref:restriction endonuclease n=1 Tax=Streptomyces sp. NPDC059904 TaxID=3346996 RepID=UPI00364E8107